MDLLTDFNNYKINIDLLQLTAVSKESALIGKDILSKNYNKIQKISSKGRKGDLVTNVDLEVENAIKDFLIKETPEISIIAEESGKTKTN